MLEIIWLLIFHPFLVSLADKQKAKMRNLQLSNRVAVGGGFGISGISCIAVNVDSGVVFAATSTEIVAIDRQAGEVIFILFLF